MTVLRSGIARRFAGAANVPKVEWGRCMFVFDAVALALLAAAAVSDMRCRLIPDWAAGGLLLLFLVLNVIDGRWSVVGDGLAAAALLFAVGAALFYLGWLGGGDVKLMAGVGAWAGLGGLPQFALLTSLIGGVLSLLYAGWAISGRWRGVAQPLDQVEVPYGVAIALGAAPLILATL
jgi:prepilin peptidase CpaA